MMNLRVGPHPRLKTRQMRLALLTSTILSVGGMNAGFAQTAPVVQPAMRSVSVPAGPLTAALNRLSAQTGLQLLFDAQLANGKTTRGAQGNLTARQALTEVLAGTSLNARFTGGNSATIVGPSNVDAGAVPDGSILLDTIDVSGGGRSSPSDAPYQTPGPTAYISQETIERFRGSSPADIFRGTPGVMSGEARNGGNSIDVNIRGMQGMGRVAVTVDGAENSTVVYQGYQGISNRTYVDPDPLAGVDIQKGSDANSRGIAGTVAMRTLGADDVVKPGEKWGVMVKSGFGTNTANPLPGQVGGYLYTNIPGSAGGTPGVATPSPDGMNRPGWLTPTSGSFSAVAAVKEQFYDLLWGYAFRKQGNYFAGKNGPGAEPASQGRQPYCCYGWYYGDYLGNGGLTNYRAGEQVLNTQSETESYLAKATVRDDNGQSLQLGYTGYRSKAGDMIASIFTDNQSQPKQQTQQNITQVDTGTARYRWKPDNNDLVDVKANLWLTNFSLRTPVRSGFAVNIKPEDFGLPYDYMPGNESRMWGGDLSNKSHLSLDRFGALDVEYGMSYLSEETRPTPFTNQLNNIPSRDGARQEVGGFGKIAYKPVDWLTLKGGLRYSHDWAQDRSTTTFLGLANPEPTRERGGYSPSAGLVLEPVTGTQFYANYSSALRMPTIFESVAAYSITVNPNLGPERSNNWEAGLNLIKDGAFSANDKMMLKFGYFNWDVKDYVAREYTVTGSNPSGSPIYGLMIYNIDRARFEGLEFSGKYENNGFAAQLAANYYLNVEFCRTADTCARSTLTSDYATNQIPPEYSASLTLSQKLLNDDLTVGGRVSYTGPRSIDHGLVQYGAAAIIAPIEWKPYWLVDLFTEYKATKDVTLWATLENATDQYYVDPLSLVQQPGPGRTLRVGVTGKFGGAEAAAPFSWANLSSTGQGAGDWSGFQVGLNGAYNFTNFSGSSVALDGAMTRYSAEEAPNQSIKALSFGVHAGYDYQFVNRVILGVQADFAKSEISGSKVAYANESFGYGNDLFRTRQFEAVTRSEIDWMSTVRGRLGYAFNDRLMIYATGGAAFLRQHEDRTQYAVSGESMTTAPIFSEGVSTIRTGYTVGAGAEYALGNGWSLSGEFQFASFGRKEINLPNARAGVMPNTSTTVVLVPGIPDDWNYDDPTCLDNGFTGPGCYIPGKPPVTETKVTQGSSFQRMGRKILSKIDIPTIRVGLTYRF